MAFTKDIVETLAKKSAYICNNPSCHCLTIGPSLVDDAIKLKIGEGAHIIGDKKGAARHIDGDNNRNEIENGIWLCSSCHSMIDKHKGKDFPASRLSKWKDDFEKKLFGMLLSHESAIPLVMKHTANHKIISDLIDFMSDKGVFYISACYENGHYCSLSLKETRDYIKSLQPQVIYDDSIKMILKDILKPITRAMNMTSKDSGMPINVLESYLLTMRFELQGPFREIQRLGVKVPNVLTDIHPIHDDIN